MPHSRLIRWQQFLSLASRSRGFLWRFAIVALLFGTLLGTVLSYLRPPATYLFGERVLAGAGLTSLDDDAKWLTPTASNAQLVDAFVDELADESLWFIDVLRAMPDLAPYVAANDHERLRSALTTKFTAAEAQLAIDYLAACDLRDAAATVRLQAHADKSPPQRFACYALGKIEMKHGNHRAAYELFQKEGADKDATESRYMVIQALLKTKDFSALDKLRLEPRYEPYFTPYVDLDLAIAKRDWRGILRSVPLTQIDSYQRNTIVVTIIAGLAWALFLVNLGELKPLLSRIGALCTLGFFAGVLSTTATLYLVVMQDEILGFSEAGDIYRIFAYNIGGVAAREEICKLLLFVPLLPFLLKKGNELEACMVAAFVGLGFAIEENGGYFMLSEAASAPGRFLTANFFHVALTGLNGLALFRACKHGPQGVYDFLTVLPLSILAHGTYDALLSLPEVESSEYMAMIAYVVFAYYFFRRVHELKQNVRRTLSLTGSFVFGVAILSASVIAYQMATLGGAAGARLIFQELIGSAAMLFVFFHEFNEPLTP